jgi:WD40 repeat protein
LVTASLDGTAQVWYTLSGRRAGPLLRHGGVVHDASFSPDGRRVLTASNDGTAGLWETSTGRPILSLPHNDWVKRARFSRDGKRILTLAGDTAQIWDAATGRRVVRPMKETSWVGEAAFDADGRLLVIGCYDGTARVWDATTGEPLTPPIRHGTAEHRAQVFQVAFSPDGRYVLTGSTAGGWLWKLAQDERPVAELTQLAMLLSGHRIDTSGGLVPLDPTALRDLWQRQKAQRRAGANP